MGTHISSSRLFLLFLFLFLIHKFSITTTTITLPTTAAAAAAAAALIAASTCNNNYHYFCIHQKNKINHFFYSFILSFMWSFSVTQRNLSICEAAATVSKVSPNYLNTNLMTH